MSTFPPPPPFEVWTDVGPTMWINDALQPQGRVKDATLVDTVVMASAALRGDVVYTCDVDDLGRLQRYFPAVRVLGVLVA